MAEIVSSAVVQESVSKILSSVLKKYEQKQDSNVFRTLERLEMAQIRLEAILQTSDKWDITDTSLLRWRRKLRCAAQECNDTIHSCRRRILEEEHTEKEVSNSSLPKRVVHATRSFVFSIFNQNNNDFNKSVVQRFEWFANGASEFLRLLELGGTPRCHMPFDPLIRHLLAGKMLKHRIISAKKSPLFLLLAPFISAEHGIECRLFIMRKDSKVLHDDFCLVVTLQLSESTDIVGVVIQCLQLFAPLNKYTVESIRLELMQLPTQDFSWVPYAESHQKKCWDNAHILGKQWFRPNPLCCKQHGKHHLCHGSKLDKSSGLQHVSLEPVVIASLVYNLSLSECNKQTASLSECKSSLCDRPYLRAVVHFAPHGSSKDIAGISGKEQHCLHSIFSFGQLQEMLLPKAIDYFCQNEEATVYQMLWRSRHGIAFIQVEKAKIFMPSTRRIFHEAKRRKLLQGLDEEVDCLTYRISHFLDFWSTHAPIQLQGLIRDVYKEVKGKQKKRITAA